MTIAAPPTQSVREISQRYLGLLEISGEAVLIVCDSLIVSANAAAHMLLGLPATGQLLGRPFLDFVSPECHAEVAERIGALKVRGQTAAFVHRNLLRPDGKPTSVELALHACGHGGRLATQILMRDLSEHHRLRAELTHLEHFDPLTELANRTGFLDRLDDAIVRARRSEELLAVVCMGLDNFRGVNDVMGQHGGDLVLMQVAERLTRIAGRSDTIARMGGDEFGLILEGLADNVDGVAAAVRRRTTSLGQAFTVAGVEICATLSMGIAIFPAQAEIPDRLMRKSMLAMKYAKQHGGNQCRLYSIELNALDRDETRRRVQTGRRLKRLTCREHEVLHLVVAGKTSRTIGALLGISARTIDVHRQRVMEKMEADSVAELVHTLDRHF